jgi:hypothetical protein
LIYRNLLGFSPYSIERVDPEADNAAAAMGDYYPGGTFMTEDQFSARYCASAAILPGTGNAANALNGGPPAAAVSAAQSDDRPAALAQTGLKVLAVLVGVALILIGLLLWRQRPTKPTV